jgi:hypothetical protein
MDSDGFRTPQSPWFFTQPAQVLIEANAVNRVAPKKGSDPTPDNRFPGWAAVMDDGRLATDYRPRCAVNIPTGSQYATRQFMQANGEALMNQSRQRQAALTGAGLAYDSSTEVPPVAYVTCAATGKCGYQPNMPRGVGIERSEPIPELFGTFASSRPSMWRPAAPRGTTKYEGGRNTPRGGTV